MPRERTPHRLALRGHLRSSPETGDMSPSGHQPALETLGHQQRPLPVVRRTHRHGKGRIAHPGSQL